MSSIFIENNTVQFMIFALCTTSTMLLLSNLYPMKDNKENYVMFEIKYVAHHGPKTSTSKHHASNEVYLIKPEN